MKKKGQMNIVGTVIGAMAGLVSLVVIVVVSGLINTVSADVVSDIEDGMSSATASAIANTTLENQQTIADRTDSFTNTGLGMLIIGVIIAFAGGFIGSRF